ncbi:MAG: glycosyltransferase family 4 protein [Desulfovibrio sp.]
MSGALRVLCIGHAHSPQFPQRCAMLQSAGFHVTEMTGQAEAVTPGADALQPRGLPLGRAWRLTALSRFAHFFALVRGLAPDLLFVQYAQGLWAWLATTTGLPVVVSVMGGDVLFDEQADPGPLQRAATLGCLRDASLVLCKSAYLADRVRAMRPHGEVRIAAWGVDRAVFRPARNAEEKSAARRQAGLPEKGPLLFSPRALQPLYNIKTIVRAFARSGLADQDAHLALSTFHADQTCEAEVRGLCREQGLEKSVHFLPPLDAQGMARMYCAADLGISVPDSDGLPQTLFEAAACGLPLILRDLPNYRAELRRHEAALLVGPDAPDKKSEELTSALRLLATDPDLRQRLAQGAARFAREHERDSGANALPVLFQRAAQQHGARQGVRLAQLLRTVATLFQGPAPVARRGQPVFPGLRTYVRALLHSVPDRRNANRS